MADNSGRWTNEEHDRFLQGLDMYGKKWTKVAEVVGSRSTVQVRSHAQKYFQKMVKGGGTRDAVEASFLSGGTGGGIPRPYQRRRLNIDQLRCTLPVPPPLQPFVPPGSGDIASGLYTYLSPDCVPTGESQRHPAVSGNAVSSALGANNNTHHVGFTPPPTPPPEEEAKGAGEDTRNSIPEWYKKGNDMSKLLDQAEGLDWLADSGAPPSYSLGGGDGGADPHIPQSGGGIGHDDQRRYLGGGAGYPHDPHDPRGGGGGGGGGASPGVQLGGGDLACPPRSTHLIGGGGRGRGGGGGQRGHANSPRAQPPPQGQGGGGRARGGNGRSGGRGGEAREKRQGRGGSGHAAAGASAGAPGGGGHGGRVSSSSYGGAAAAPRDALSDPPWPDSEYALAGGIVDAGFSGGGGGGHERGGAHHAGEGGLGGGGLGGALGVVGSVGGGPIDDALGEDESPRVSTGNGTPEMNFSTMEVDESMFDALLNDEDFMVASQVP